MAKSTSKTAKTTTKKEAAPKVEAKPKAAAKAPAAAKPVAPVKAPAAAPAPAPVKAAAPVKASAKTISAQERYHMIDEAAYYRAEKSGFQVDPHQNWIAAEKEIDELLAKQGLVVSK